MREPSLQPPPKHTLHLGNQKELLDRRRDELERWMWRLIARPEVARSGVLKAFLEFDKAMARAQQQHQRAASASGGAAAGTGPTPAASTSSRSTSPISTPPLAASPHHPQLRAPHLAPPSSSERPHARPVGGAAGAAHNGVSAAGRLPGASAASSEAGAGLADWDDTRSEASGASYATGTTGTGGGGGGAALDGLRAALGGAASAAAASAGAAALAAAASSGGDERGAAAMRLGLRLEQRADVRRLVETLARAVRQAGDDLAAAADEAQQLRANNGALTVQLTALTGGAGPRAWEELQQQLATVRWLRERARNGYRNGGREQRMAGPSGSLRWRPPHRLLSAFAAAVAAP
jgi:hypothetical protein